MAFVEGYRQAEDDDHTEVSIIPTGDEKKKRKKKKTQRGLTRTAAARGVGRRSRLHPPGREEVQERVQLLVREGPCGRRGVRAGRLRLGGLRATREARGGHQSPDEGDQPRGAAVPDGRPPKLGNHCHAD